MDFTSWVKLDMWVPRLFKTLLYRKEEYKDILENVHGKAVSN